MKTIALNLEIKKKLLQEEKKSLNIKCKPNRFRHKSDSNKQIKNKHMRKLAKKRFWFVLIIHPDTWVPY